MDRLKGGGQVIKVGIKRARTIAHSVDYFLLKDVFYVIVVLALFFSVFVADGKSKISFL